MKLIIQSDDLGITEAVSCGIARAAREGAITCTGLFSNMPAAPFAVELMKPYPQICWGRILIWLQGALVQIQKKYHLWYRKWFISDFWHALGH